MSGSEKFWTRPELAHIQTFARSRLVCPWATLGVTLVRAACMIPPHVNIPPITGGEVAPNLFVNLVGPSGMGKDSAKAASLDAVQFSGPFGFEPPDFPVGSGEGIAKVFDQTSAGADDDDEEGGEEQIHTAIFSSSEIDRLAVLTARRGATIESVIRQLYNGESIGFTNAGKDTRTNVPRLSYRAGLLFGVQPLKAGWLLAGEDGGTPQRFTWMPVQDHTVPDVPPDEPEKPWQVEVPAWPTSTSRIDVPKFIWQLVQENRRAQHRGEVDALDGHRLLNKLKIAVALMALAGRMSVTDDDWTLAGTIMAVSDQTRENCVRAAADKARQVNRDRAAARLASEDYTADSKHRRAKARIREQLSKLAVGESMRRNRSRHALRIDIRDYWDAAMAELVEDGEASEVQINGHTEYIPCTGYDRYPPHGQAKEGGYGSYRVRTESRRPPGETASNRPECEPVSNGNASQPATLPRRNGHVYSDPALLCCPICDSPKPLRPDGMCEPCAVSLHHPPSKPIDVQEDCV
ncbi:hypothetical protein [Mycolicibacterium pulveris]|uniref:hypothetical protein n=1 Tax=Mycolicibacterium pulveris TaxID=36813 RepID=UPI003CFAF3F0